MTSIQQQFNDEFGEIMLNGLSSTASYIPLRQSNRYGLNVAIRPAVFRAGPDVVVFGGKLRVGYTLDNNGNPVKAKVLDLQEKDAVLRLRDFCKGFKWLKESRKRFSTIVGFGFAASQYDGGTAIERIEENDLVAEFINRLERTYKQYNEGATFTNKTQVIAAIDASWRMLMETVFIALPATTQLADHIIGKQSKLLNKAQDNYTDNVVSFGGKVKELAAIAAEKEGTNAE